MTRGLVIKNTGSWYTVKTAGGRVVDCKVKGSFRLKGIRSTSPVAVGDHVCIDINAEGTGLITDIADRRNYIIRRASNLSKQSHILAANVDQALLMVTTAHPATSTTFVDRFLAGAEAYRVPVVLALNKQDLSTGGERRRGDELMAVYARMGYTCLRLSALTGEGVEALRPLLAGRVTLLSGHSGVGKSTLINRLVPGAGLRTAPISEAHDTGTHTTTFSEMLPLEGGGWLIDTPGIKGFGTFDIAPAELTSYFRDIFAAAQGCRFSNCTHTHEPGCAVRQAVESGDIAPSRYASYLSMLGDEDEDKYRPAY